jgi:anhydro-N-acetylmuramic acid kinase
MKIIGLMSGTSADGVDAALCEIEGAPPQISARIIDGITLPYPPELRQRVLDVMTIDTSRIDELTEVNMAVSNQFAAGALAIIERVGLTVGDIDLIGSAGQTVWHQVSAAGAVTSTLQLTEPSIIAERTGLTTIGNFRQRDVAAGGQGAPLTSYADWLLLRHPTKWRAVQNVGGIGNVTFLPPLNDSQSQPLAFDTGPGNALLDVTAASLTGGARQFDDGGAMAKGGRVDEDWLYTLLKHPYYQRKPPKTTGRELFSRAMAAELLAEGRKRKLDDSSIMATLTALTATSIADAYEKFAPAEIGEVVLGGGGQRNPVLMGLLRDLLPATVISHEDIGIDSKNKEALVFALIAHETWHHRPGNHPALTGARQATVLGEIAPGANYATLIRKTWC